MLYFLVSERLLLME